MRFWKSWIVATKDLSVFRKNKYILYSLIALPFLMGIVIPAILIFTLQTESSALTQAQLIDAAQTLVNLFIAYFVIFPQ